MNTALPQEMQQHTYAIMDEVEGSHWWFVGRRAILESFLQGIVKRCESRHEAASGVRPAKAGTQNALRILDVGCGTGANLEMLSQFGDAEGVDVSDDALAFCQRKGLKAQKGLAEKLPFADETFDLTTALDVVEHLDDDIAGLKEMYRVTKSGGYSLIFVPAFMWLWGVQDDISNHRIRYTKRQIVERLQKAGYTIERATYANWTFFAPILAGRTLMKITGIKPESENNVNVSALNGVFGKIFSSERFWLKHLDFPFGVSIVLVAKKS
jgi:SAM-dependent methyltransferase